MHELPISFETKIVLRDAKTKEVLREGKNAIHPQNMSRVIARALANEPNALIHRIAFGNGGTYTDAAGNVVFNAPNDGNSGGWEARLYNETYSEIVDELHPDFKSDPGSADVNNVRMAGGASPADDPEGGGVTSVEVGRKSNIVVTVVINENEPNGQVPSQNLGPTVTPDETFFMFDEIALYSPGKPAKSTSGYSTVNVGTGKTSTDVTNLAPNTNYNVPVTVNGTSLLGVIHTPASGTGAAGAFTYGDICEGINTGAWITSGDNLNDYITVYITDRSGGAYPTILGLQSYGFLTFESKTTGTASTVLLTFSGGDAANFFNVITNGVGGNVNVNNVPGVAAGVANDPVNPENERERLLTHFIFDPVLKSRDRAIEIVYTLTVSVGRSTDSQVVQVTGTPLPSPTPTPTGTASVTLTPTPTVSVSPSLSPTATPTPTPSVTPSTSVAGPFGIPAGFLLNVYDPADSTTKIKQTNGGALESLPVLASAVGLFEGIFSPTATDKYTILDGVYYASTDGGDTFASGTVFDGNTNPALIGSITQFGTKYYAIDSAAGDLFVSDTPDMASATVAYSLSTNNLHAPNMMRVLNGRLVLACRTWDDLAGYTETYSKLLSTADGTTWEVHNIVVDGATTTEFWADAVDSDGSDIVMLVKKKTLGAATVVNAIFRTSDFGATWTETVVMGTYATDADVELQGLIKCAAADTFLAYIYDRVQVKSFILRSTDGGVTWTEAWSANTVWLTHHQKSHVSASTDLLITGSSGSPATPNFVYTNDYGLTFQTITTDLGCFGVTHAD